MKLPINIEELLGGRAVEGDRIEYKTGWNPDAIYRSICAFANDFDETGGGYVLPDRHPLPSGICGRDTHDGEYWHERGKCHERCHQRCHQRCHERTY